MEKTIELNSTIKQCNEILPSYFFLLNKSMLININHIIEFRYDNIPYIKFDKHILYSSVTDSRKLIALIDTLKKN